jgi:hypothetical protein
MLKLTLDTNVIIDLEESNEYAPDLAKLVEMNRKRRINLRITAASASERKLDQKYASRLSEFQHRLAAIGLDGLEILPTICYADVSFFDYCLVGDGELSVLECKIQRILFPKIQLEYRNYCEKRSLKLSDEKAWHKWTNAKCDVLSLWSHIWYKGDIFVTRDNNYHKKTKKPDLIRLGAGDILTPNVALTRIKNEKNL